MLIYNKWKIKLLIKPDNKQRNEINYFLKKTP